MKNIYSRILTAVAASLFVMGMNAQEQASESNSSSDKVAKAGQVSIGIDFNPIVAAKSSSASTVASVGKFMFKDVISEKEKTPNEMFFLAQKPMLAIAVKYKLSDVIAFKGSIGFSGGKMSYREYVRDDAAYYNNPLSNAQVYDVINFSYTGGGVQAGVEFSGGKKSLRFIGGIGLQYSFGGGSASMQYGNSVTSANQTPTCMDKITALNDYSGSVQMDYARPVTQYGVGISHGIGLYANMGVEWFFIKNVSLAATVDITPIMVAFQPQTYITYEGYNKYSGLVEEYNRLVSPGSTYLLYGTDNIGMSISLNYYF